MKFDNVEDLKDFLSWCKKQKIQQVSLGEMVVTFSNLALMEEETQQDNDSLYGDTQTGSLYEQALQGLVGNRVDNE